MDKVLVRGDGWEYMNMTHALRTTGSVEYSAEVHHSMEQLAEKRPPDSYPFAIHQTLDKAMAKGDWYHAGFVVNEDGRYYPYHFFLYPLVAAPIELVLDTFGLDPLRALTLANVLLVLLALGYIYYGSKLANQDKHWLAALYLLCGTTYYLFWPHPEIFSGALMLIAVLAWRDERPVLAILAAALSSNQNPPCAFLVPIVFIAYELRLWFQAKATIPHGAWKALLSRRHLLHAAIMIAAGSTALFSPIFYYIHYGTPNLIVKIGYTVPEYITFARFLSLWFDLNIGVLVANFGTYLFFTGTLLGVIIWKKRISNLAQLWFPITVCIMVVLMSVPTLSQGNWHAGYSVFFRYGYWLIIPLLIAFLDLAKIVPPPIRTTILGIALAIQSTIVLHNNVFAKYYPYLKLNGLSKDVMRTWPDLYNPIPEIFGERIVSEDGTLKDHDIFIFPADRAVAHKIMVRADMVPHDPSHRRAFTLLGRTFKPVGAYSTASVEGWTYLNGTFYQSVPRGEKIPFNDPLLKWDGWSSPEGGWRWSDSQKATITFPRIDPADLEGKLTLYGGAYKLQSVRLELNGVPIFEGQLEGEQVLTLDFDPSVLKASAENTLTFFLPDAKTDPELTNDIRALGYSFQWLILQ